MDINSWLLFCVNPLSAHFAEILYGESARVISLSVFSLLTLLKWPTRLTVTFLWTCSQVTFYWLVKAILTESWFLGLKDLTSDLKPLQVWIRHCSGAGVSCLSRIILFCDPYMQALYALKTPIPIHLILCTGSPWHYFVDFIFSNHISQRLNIFHQYMYFATVECKLWSVLDSF